MRVYRIASRISFIRKISNNDVYLTSLGKETEPEDIVVVKIPFPIHADFLPKREKEYGGAEVGYEWVSDSPTFDEFGFIEDYDDDMRVNITHIDGYLLSEEDVKKLNDAGLVGIVKAEIIAEYLEEDKKPGWLSQS